MWRVQGAVVRHLTSRVVQPRRRIGAEFVAVNFSWQQRHFVSRGTGSDEDQFANDDDVDYPTEKSIRMNRMISADDMEFFDSMAYDIDNDDEEDEEEAQGRAREEERQKIRDELDSRTGRLWTDTWEITDEDWSTKRTADDLPDWTPAMCSRISLERVQLYPDGIPTLSTLARLPLPPPPPPHPGHGETKAYTAFRKRQQYEYISQRVAALVEPEVDAILKLPTWNEKQDAVDELFEKVEFTLKEQEEVLGSYPNFGPWVERALEEYLQGVQKRSINDDVPEGSTSVKEGDGEDESKGNEESSDETEIVDKSFPSAEEDAHAKPLFADLYDESDGPETIVPKILYPLKPHLRDGPGRMVEEWELSAYKTVKRIMLRQSTRKVAQLLEDDSNPFRVYVTGRRGVGKTATLVMTVASARKSGSIVLYLPDGDRLRKLGYYIETSSHRKGMFDLPVLSQEVCTEFLTSHEDDLDGMVVDADTLSKFFTEDHLGKLQTEGSNEEGMSLVGLLQLGRDDPAVAPMCYSSVVHTLMNQTEKPFFIVADDFNCYYDHGHYFHMDYDEHVKNAIPCDKINLFEPILNAMGLSTAPDDDEQMISPPVMMKRGGIVVGTTESHAVARKFTDALDASAERAASASEESAEVPIHVVNVPRFSALEVEHIISNFEATGIGRLRFDRGDTVMNYQEVAYLRMVSGGVGQNLIDECVV